MPVAVALPLASEPTPSEPPPVVDEVPLTPDPLPVEPTAEPTGSIEVIPPEAWVVDWQRRMRVAKVGLVVAHASVPLSVGALYVGILSVAMHDEHTGAALLGGGLVGILVVAPVGDGLLLFGSLGASRSLRERGVEVPDAAGRVGIGLLVAGEACLAAGILGIANSTGWVFKEPMFPSALLLHYGAIAAGTIQKRAAMRACPGCADIVLAPAFLPTGSSMGPSDVLGSSPWLPGATLAIRW